ncbi:MAG: DUF2851 family protein [Bacteroidota bacterium]|nr:DUF2851 family protein [Bacteroidota bacterium]
MKEEFIHYIWKTKQFNPTDLRTESGQPVTIIHPGEHNHSSGPDFFNAQLIIGEMSWSGNVEIHTKASDWLRHKHQHDHAYNNVILHVVYESDLPLQSNYRQDLPTLVLRDRIDMGLYEKYLQLRSSKTKIPCSSRLKAVPAILKTTWLSRILAERLERKVSELNTELGQNKNDWEETFYRHISRQFGMKVNAEPFQWLSACVPYRMLRKQNDNLLQTEALLFGQSGLLPEKFSDTYTNALIREYMHLQVKYNIRPMPAHWWKFMRLRPNNFPTIRIAQLAGLFVRQPQLFRMCMEENDPAELRKIFAIPASGYWNTHYRFGKVSRRSEKNMGAQAIDTILINTIAPFKFLYGKIKGNEELQQQAIALLEKIGSENNKIIREWSEFGIEPVCAAESQALLELTKKYCEKKKCLNCEIGNYMIGNYLIGK